MTIVERLKALAVKCTDAASASAVPGSTTEEVLGYIEENFDVDGEDGQDGADGLSVTAIAFTKTEGEITGGTATLSDGSTIAITVTEAE